MSNSGDVVKIGILVCFFVFVKYVKQMKLIESSVFTAVHLFFRIVSSSLISDIIKEMSMGIFFQSKRTSSRIK